MRRLIVLGVLVLAGVASIAVTRAQQDPTAIHIEKLRNNIPNS